MDFLRTVSAAVVFLTLIVGSQCLEIKIQETYGTKDDGVVGIGSTFSVYCSVPEIRPGQLVVWYKKQGGGLPIVLGFNDFIMDPTAKLKFVGSSLFTGEDESDLLAFIINLQEDVGAEPTDSGQYGCVLSSKIPESGSDPMDDAVWATVVVPVPLESIHLYSVKAEDAHDPLKYYHEYVDGEDIRMTEGEQLYFRCVAKGSNPAADVRMYLGDKEITSQFSNITTDRPVESEEVPSSAGNIHYVYDVAMTSNNPIRIDREDNKRPITCNASIPHQTALEISVLPTMLYRPEIECHDTISSYRERQAKLQCVVRATPQLSNEQFHYNDTLANGQPSAQWIQVGESAGQMFFRKEMGEYEDQYVYSLEFTNVPEQAFRNYQFLGNYLFPSSEKFVNVTSSARLLLDNPGAVMDESGASSVQAISLLSLLAIVAVYFHL